MDNYGIAPEPIARIQIRNLVRDTAALAETSCILSQTGATAQAVKCSREAISRISKVKEAEERIRIRVVCGIALADAGMIEGALEVDRARQKERAILNVRNQFAAALVQEYASSHGLTSEDKKFVTQIFDELRSEQFEEYRAPIIRAIALARAKAGKFNAALATVKTIKSPRWQVTVRAELAAALSAGGHLAQAKFVVEELVRTNSEPHALSEAAAILGNGGMTNAANLVASKVIGDSFKRRFDSESRALSEFSGDLSALRNVGMSPETAKTVLDRYRVSDRVFMPLNPKASARDLAACALALSWVGERASAQRAISMAQNAVRSNGDAAEKSAVYSSAAQALARLGLFRAARRAAEQSSAASDRLNAFAAIVRERARAEAAPLGNFFEPVREVQHSRMTGLFHYFTPFIGILKGARNGLRARCPLRLATPKLVLRLRGNKRKYSESNEVSLTHPGFTVIDSESISKLLRRTQTTLVRLILSSCDGSYLE